MHQFNNWVKESPVNWAFRALRGGKDMKKIALLLFLLSCDYAFGQVNYVPVMVAFPHIAVGGDPNGQNYVTLLQLVNNNSSFTIGHVALFSDSGAPLAVLFDGQGPQSTMDVKLDSGQTRQIQITLNGIITAGWMEITYSPSDALTTVILQFRSGTTLLSEIGVEPAFDSISAGTPFSAGNSRSAGTRRPVSSS